MAQGQRVKTQQSTNQLFSEHTTIKTPITGSFKIFVIIEPDAQCGRRPLDRRHIQWTQRNWGATRRPDQRTQLDQAQAPSGGVLVEPEATAPQGCAGLGMGSARAAGGWLQFTADSPVPFSVQSELSRSPHLLFKVLMLPSNKTACQRGHVSFQ